MGVTVVVIIRRLPVYLNIVVLVHDAILLRVKGIGTHAARLRVVSFPYALRMDSLLYRSLTRYVRPNLRM